MHLFIQFVKIEQSGKEKDVGLGKDLGSPEVQSRHMSEHIGFDTANHPMKIANCISFSSV